MKKVNLTIIILFIALGSIYSQTLMTINNEPISVEEFKKVYLKNNTSKSSFSNKEVNDYIELFTLYKMKLIEAKAKKIDTSSALKEDYIKYSDQLALSYFTDKNYLEKLTKLQYERSLKDLKVAHIMIKLNQNATPVDTLKAYNKLLELSKTLTPQNFNQIATTQSEDDNTKPRGGVLGYVTTFMTFPAFEEAIYNTPKGQISPIFKTQFGYHIAYVMDERPARGKVKVAHIYINDKTEEDKKNHTAEKQINLAYNELSKGKKKFEDVVAKYSQDETTIKSKGVLNPFGISEMIVDFEENSFGLKTVGEFSKPFKTDYGWHIVSLIEKIPVGTFENAVEGIKKRLEKDPRANNMKGMAQEKLKQKYKLSENTVAIQKLIEMTPDNTFENKNWVFKAGSESKSSLFTINGSSFTGSDLAKFINENYSGIVAKNKTEILLSLINNYKEKIVMDVAKSDLIKEKEDFRNLLDEYQNGLLIFDIMDKEIWQKANTDTNGLKNFYETVKENYKYKERAEVSMFSTKDKALSQKIEKMLQDSKSTATKINETLRKSSDSNNFKYILKTIERGENGTLDIKPWTIGATEVIMNTENDLINIFKFEKSIPITPKPLNEIKGRVQNLYQTKLEKEWNDYLRKKYTTKIDQKVLNTLIKE